MPEQDYDEQAFQEFLNESRDLLEDLEPALLDLEENPGDLELVEEPFRILHSIKGMSSFFGLTPIKRLSHSLEDLLGEIQDGQLEVQQEVMELLFRGTEHLNGFYDELFEGNRKLELTQNQEDLIESIEKTAESGVGLQDYFLNVIDDVENQLSELSDREGLDSEEEVKSIHGVLSTARRRIHADEDDGDEADEGLPDQLFHEDMTRDGEEIGESLRSMELVCREMVTEEKTDAGEEIVEGFREDFQAVQELAQNKNWEEVIPVLDEMQEEFDRFMESAGFGELLAGSFLNHMKTLRDIFSETGEASPRETQQNASSGAESSVSRTFRVEEEKVDDFMEYVGELIVTGEMYKHLENEIKGTALSSDLQEQLRSTNQAFRDLSNDLRESLMGVRELKINDLLKKYPVMVRKLTADMNKEIEVELEGEETTVDKIFVEELETPLTHLVRNAVDHGIEPVEERKHKDKEPTGAIELHVHGTDEFLEITVRDDGQGLDIERIKSQVLEKGLASETELENLSRGEIFDFIFESGFSTTDEVTDVSGRGVGMNDVKQTIDDLNGSISVQSEPDDGTEINLTLPRSQSVNVIETLVIGLENQRFALPLEKIVESISLSKASIRSVEDQHEIVEVRNSIFPLFRLRDLFDLDGSVDTDGSVAMLLENDGDHFAILADDLGKQQKVVVKDLGPVFQGVEYASGAAVMGDGDVCLVLDVDKLGEEARRFDGVESHQGNLI